MDEGRARGKRLIVSCGNAEATRLGWPRRLDGIYAAGTYCVSDATVTGFSR
jgi:hypothetical protein